MEGLIFGIFYGNLKTIAFFFTLFKGYICN